MRAEALPERVEAPAGLERLCGGTRRRRAHLRFAPGARASRPRVHVCPLIPPTPFLSRVDFLGEMSDFLLSGAPLPHIPPTPFSHKVRRGSWGVLKPETEDGT